MPYYTVDRKPGVPVPNDAGLEQVYVYIERLHHCAQLIFQQPFPDDPGSRRDLTIRCRCSSDRSNFGEPLD
jgi:hypothetical protein